MQGLSRLLAIVPLLYIALAGYQKGHFTKIEVFGERCTGTNWFVMTCTLNFGKSFLPATHKDPNRPALIFQPHGWKHGHLDAEMIKRRVAENNQETNRTLFIVLTKNPYSWVESLRRTPHHATHHQSLSMHDFLRKEWTSYYGNWMDKNAKLRLMTDDLQPDGTPYSNVLTMRTGKMLSHIRIKDLVSHAEVIRYEDAMFNGTWIFNRLASKYGLEFVHGNFVDNTAQCGPYSFSTGKCKETKEAKERYLKRRRYYDNQGYLKSYSKSDLNFVWEQLNETLEASLGYTLVPYQVIKAGEEDRAERNSLDREYVSEDGDNGGQSDKREQTGKQKASPS
eukprot:gb/GEZN01011950.1/.p1 GENE.gb/GEZN01011950.1/~~gb/GEZN01011950.1/.p1  ORF type:complete len:369 (+),score=45.48 gb/GEZN01011950.1/:98-1108(+)